MFELLTRIQSLSYYEQLVTWIPVVLLVLFALGLVVPYMKRCTQAERLRKTVAKLGRDSMSNVILEDGLDGYAYIDHLVLQPAGLLVLTLVEGRGAIFGALGMDQWAQVVGKRTSRFPNPIVLNQERALAVKNHAPGIPVSSVVLFSDQCSFPKGQPEGVMLPKDLAAARGELLPVPDQLQSAWKNLRDTAKRNAAKLGDDIAYLKNRKSYGRLVMSLLLLTVAVSWAVWRLWTVHKLLSF